MDHSLHYSIKSSDQITLSENEKKMFNLGQQDIDELIQDEKRMEKEREIMRINEESGRRLPPIENYEKERINDNKKRQLNRSESTLRSNSAPKLATRKIRRRIICSIEGNEIT